MPEFVWPWLLALLPLPWLWQRLLPAARSHAAALRLPHRQEIAALAGIAPGRAGLRGAPRWLWLVWALLCVALARPQALAEADMPPRSGRDLMLAVDLSGSMSETDMRLAGRPVDRLTAVKAVLADFLDRRAGDRVGLVLFGQRAYAVTPLTFDLETVRQQVLDSVVGLAGRETAIGDALALSVKRLREQADPERPNPNRVIILLTDGVNNAGVVPPEKAAELAVLERIRVHTIGFGGEVRSGAFGLPFGRSEPEIDEDALRAISARTGGRFFRARDTDELAGIYAELDRLEAITHEGRPQRPRRELYPWPLGTALVLTLLALAVPRREARA
ncbi:vWA domain-containing protein [Rehaibacterium terrae]|uniref:Ca-activated chloride channel family protein n=1 Tax=Rehaibacterium terrae TaxID=1341696 RepID=A0A7W7Y0Y8_9GAMM|nr:VWA domain-containing protein [Rehaibacterium terrae]MBB5016088.1 Ca-activated chloride channel family protein [Rehaibacterium terrae]